MNRYCKYGAGTLRCDECDADCTYEYQQRMLRLIAVLPAAEAVAMIKEKKAERKVDINTEQCIGCEKGVKGFMDGRADTEARLHGMVEAAYLRGLEEGSRAAVTRPTGPEDAQNGLLVIADWYREHGDERRADLIDKIARLALDPGYDYTIEVT